MKLELKHLAKRLPYGVYCQTKDKGEIVVSELNAAYSDNSYTFMNIVESEKGFEDIKPILRPLSDLVNEIEHGGERFVPIELLGYDFYNNDIIDSHFVGFSGENVNINILDYVFDYEKLLQWHFDVDGLIENGLAIDVNTLDVNPYK